MKPIKYSKLSSYRIKKLIVHFCVDIDAHRTSILTEINRNTVNRYFKVFRERIYQKRQQDGDNFSAR